MKREIVMETHGVTITFAGDPRKSQDFTRAQDRFHRQADNCGCPNGGCTNCRCKKG